MARYQNFTSQLMHTLDHSGKFITDYCYCHEKYLGRRALDATLKREHLLHETTNSRLKFTFNNFIFQNFHVENVVQVEDNKELTKSEVTYTS